MGCHSRDARRLPLHPTHHPALPFCSPRVARPWLRVLLAASAPTDAAFPHNELTNAALAACEEAGAEYTVVVGADVIIPSHAYVGLLVDAQRTKWDTPRGALRLGRCGRAGREQYGRQVHASQPPSLTQP